MRLIDADALRAEACRIGGHIYSDWETAGVLRLIDAAPTIDAVQVVRCRDCQQRRRTMKRQTCALSGASVADGHFCGYGKRARMDADAPETKESRDCSTCHWDSDDLRSYCYDCDARTGYYKWEPKRDAPERREGISK